MIRTPERSPLSADRRPLVVVATRGRPHETAELLKCLAVQKPVPALTVVVGASVADLPSLVEGSASRVLLLVSDTAGSSHQRNRGLSALISAGFLQVRMDYVAFFDDDFRPAPNWLQSATEAFACDERLAGLSGHVLADGINGDAVTEAEAQAYLSGALAPRGHWSAGPERQVESLYGCNMAVTAEVALGCRFDEALPLYSWQEDCDYSGQARRFGQTRLVPSCRGVHLGVKSARTSGVRLGYSQIANPIRIAARGNMTRLRLGRFLARAFAANLVKSLRHHPSVDYSGRLKGNLLAIADLAWGRCHPERILDLPS